MHRSLALGCLLLSLVAAGCAGRSQVAELEPGVFALTQQAASPATAARLGVAAAQAHCAREGREFEVVRSEIGVTDYRIAFRCLRREAGFLTPSTIGTDTLDTSAPVDTSVPVTPLPGTGR
jgi:hypothetical protein